jgi:hypothetical protein
VAWRDLFKTRRILIPEREHEGKPSGFFLISLG